MRWSSIRQWSSRLSQERWTLIDGAEWFVIQESPQTSRYYSCELLLSITCEYPIHTGAGTSMIFYKAQRAYAMGKKPTYRPFEPVLMACNEAVESCLSRNRSRALHAISYLYHMLDFRHAPQQSAEMAKLYDYCEQLIYMEEFQDAVVLLDRLRGTWRRIVQVSVSGVSN